jgi:ribonucleoside-diphosphate reductase alpha chain
VDSSHTFPRFSYSHLGYSTQLSSFGKTTGTVVLDERAKAKLQGYTGDSCGECGHFMMVRNGSCLKCQSCGATTGCS